MRWHFVLYGDVWFRYGNCWRTGPECHGLWLCWFFSLGCWSGLVVLSFLYHCKLQPTSILHVTFFICNISSSVSMSGSLYANILLLHFYNDLFTICLDKCFGYFDCLGLGICTLVSCPGGHCIFRAEVWCLYLLFGCARAERDTVCV